MSRTCEKGNGANPSSEYYWRGTANLSYINADTAVQIKKIDSLSFKDCTCNFKNFNRKSSPTKGLLLAYQKALGEANKIEGFVELVPVSYQYITKRDTISAFNFMNTDTSSVLYYKEKVKDLVPVNWGSCGFLTNIQEVRIYELGDRRVLIVNLNCSDLSTESQNMISENFQRFNSVSTAITDTPTRWHGLSRDYVIEY